MEKGWTNRSTVDKTIYIIVRMRRIQSLNQILINLIKSLYTASGKMPK